jgi:hypothetical protein
MEQQQRVAIVGSGLAGLVSAYLLHNDPRQRYAVKVLESVGFLFWTRFVCTIGIDMVGNLAIARFRVHIHTQCHENVVGPRRSAHARLRWQLLQQPEVHVRLSQSSIPLAAIPLSVRGSAGGFVECRLLLLRPCLQSTSASASTTRCRNNTIPSGGLVPDIVLRLVFAVLLLRSTVCRRNVAAISAQNAHTEALRDLLPSATHIERYDVPP